jgi:hypothetical protein
MSATTLQPAEAALADELALCYADPLRFVRLAYPWGEPGELRDEAGPDTWQAELLTEIGREVRARRFDGQRAVRPIREAVASGHGIGKTTLVAWIVDWLMSTRPHAVGTVTANTFPQLQGKTWAAIQRWTRLCITAHWWAINDSRMYHRDYPASWHCAPQTCREENSEAFAGQHAARSTSFYVMDEASAIPESIWQVAEGGLTDGEPMIFAFGNPTRSQGAFYRITFGSDSGRWMHRSIDSRDCRLPNKAQIAEWIEQYGEDSDFVRVRVRGLPPRASDLQFIDQDRVWAAQRRPAPIVLPDEPLIAGVDVSDGGSAWNVVRFRRGLDARSIPPIRIPGEHTRNDRAVFLGRLAEVLRDQRPESRVAAMFVDSAFGAPYVERLQALGFNQVHEIRFGGASPDRHYKNMRAYMWGRLKEWLLTGAIPEKDQDLELGLTAPGCGLTKSDQIVLESKQDMAKRGVASPDDADALALTFAQPVAPLLPRQLRRPPQFGGGPNSWMGT